MSGSRPPATRAARHKLLTMRDAPACTGRACIDLVTRIVTLVPCGAVQTLRLLSYGGWRQDRRCRGRDGSSSSTEPGCALGSCAGARPMRKSPGRIPVPTWSPTARGRRRWPSRSTLRQIRSGRGSSSWAGIVGAGTPGTTSTTPVAQVPNRVHPEWQDLALGDYVKYWTRRRGPVDAWQVAALEPNRFLGLHGLSDLRGRSLDPKQPRPSAYTEGLWGFLLNELPGGRTRLLSAVIKPSTLDGLDVSSTTGSTSRLSGSCRHGCWRAQAEYRKSGPCRNASRRLWKDRLANPQEAPGARRVFHPCACAHRKGGAMTIVSAPHHDRQTPPRTKLQMAAFITLLILAAIGSGAAGAGRPAGLIDIVRSAGLGRRGHIHTGTGEFQRH